MAAFRFRPAVPAVAVAAAVSLAVSGCGSRIGSAPGTATPRAATSSGTAREFGPTCARVPRSGPGSFADMARLPVATAVSRNPLLTILTSAIRRADRATGLNAAHDITLFAPTNAAFGRMSHGQLASLMQDKDALDKLLSYSVVNRRLTPAQLSKGSFTTLGTGSLTTSGSGQSYQVGNASGMARVVCGNVQTANATVYMIDTVLTLPS